MFFEQHALEPNIGAAYFWLSLVRGGRDLQTHSIEDWMERGYRALQVMENHLKTHDYFAAGHFTVADIALYAYTHVADQCDSTSATFPAIRAWLGGSSRARLRGHGLAARGPRSTIRARIAAEQLDRSLCARGPAASINNSRAQH